MRIIIGLSLAGLLAAAGTAAAQYPGYGGGYPGDTGNPGIYGGGLSPYLNLRGGRGTNPAVNYFNFTRPYTGGTFGNAMVPGGGGGFGGRPTFFPNQRPVYADDVDTNRQRVEKDKDGIMRVDMPPAGHPTGFMNTQGYFGVGGGGRGIGAGRPAASLGTPTGATPRR